LAVLLLGCANWKQPPAAPPPSPSSGDVAGALENPKRVIMEVEFVNITPPDPVDIDQSAALWQWVDETAIDTRIRQRLLVNGIRAGLIANPEQFRQRLADAAITPDVVETFLSEASVASDVAHGRQRLAMRMGRRYELPLRQPIDGSHVALLRVGDQTIGRTLHNAQYLLTLTATPADVQKQLRLKIRPEIQFGDTRQKWVSSDTALRIDNRRDTWALPELDLDLTASEGDTLVISAATPVTGIAQHMLTGAGADQGPQQLFVLISLAQVPSAAERF
jgi:hypothetical protein